MQCRTHVAQLGRLNQEFIQAGAQILVILGEDLENARSYADLLKTPFPVLADPQRAVYHLYGLEKGVFGLQRTASIILDQDGLIHYIKRRINTLTWLQESKELIQAVRF